MAPLLRGAPAPGLYAALGPRLLTSWILWALEPALKAGANVFWLDAGNSFDAYGASYAAKALGWEPKEVLNRVQLARPFNLFQLETMVSLKLPFKWKDEPVVLSDPFPLFYDEDVLEAEAKKVFGRVLRGMKKLPAVWLVLVVERKAPQGREEWLPELLKSATGVANLLGPPSLRLEAR
ncbi:MAG: hypothetical protein HY077_10230 [Elusimicrobia bacterium]|nr:hypothetical protein [Elusimicrobiota bacterium]